MPKDMIKVVRPWPAEQPRPPVVRFVARPANDPQPQPPLKQRA